MKHILGIPYRPLSPYRFASVTLVVALMIVLASVIFTNHLVRELRTQEEQYVRLWAEATERMIRAEEGEDLSLVLSIIEGNTTIPVYLLDSAGQIIDTRNVKANGRMAGTEELEELYGPIELTIEDHGTTYRYTIRYDESTLLTRLKYFPYVQFAIILIFILVVVGTLYVAQRSEQNRVWAGLSKETAHQLGTPISSLMAWQDLLRTKYPDDRLIPEMQLDIERLQTIADRFSKIGSEPELKAEDLTAIIRRTLAYMSTRISDKVSLSLQDNCPTPPKAEVNASLFGWVLENLIKNAVDAMDGVGSVTMTLSEADGQIVLDVTDTGRGIDRGLFRTVFRPGYTSKARGWGLGLSLSKRIIEDYHRGRLFIQASEIGVGTTFRIVLEQAEDSGSAA